MASVDEIWKVLTADSRQWVFDHLARYSGSGVCTRFNGLVEWAHRKQVATWSAPQAVMSDKKRKRDDNDVAQPPSKKPTLHKAEAPWIDRVDSERFDLRKALFRLVRLRIPSATALPPSSVAPPPPATHSTTGGENSFNLPADPASSTVTGGAIFGQPVPVKPETPANPPSDCEEQFTFADRRSSGPQPDNRPGTTHGSRPSAQNVQPAASSPAPTQENLGSPGVSAVYKPPFAGVDISSLKVPANSKVNLTLNVFQGPSSLHQQVTSPAPRKLKCIQCNAFYVETQNTAMKCRRHTGTGIALPFLRPNIACPGQELFGSLLTCSSQAAASMPRMKSSTTNISRVAHTESGTAAADRPTAGVATRATTTPANCQARGYFQMGFRKKAPCCQWLEEVITCSDFIRISVSFWQLRPSEGIKAWSTISILVRHSSPAIS